MRLNRLEISGFKSFAERSELAFDMGVTAIVGPNGCGKSNVVDAITWVLGEQSAKSLRGEHMQDIIFQGSDGRKPTSAAEVRLRLSGVASRPSTRGLSAPSFVDARVPRSGAAAPALLPHGEAVVAAAAGESATDVSMAETTGAFHAVSLAGVDDEPLIVRDVEL